MEYKVHKVYCLFKTHPQGNKFNKLEEIFKIKQVDFNITKCGI